jgi:hypothetical protein
LVIRSVSRARCSDVAHSAAIPLGLQQRAQAEQMVGERLVRVCALAPQLEPAQRPRELVAVGSTPRDEAAERAQLVLLLGGDDEHPVGTSARAQRDRAPGVLAAHARPRERAERDPSVAEQAQRAQQVPQHLASVGGLLAREGDQQMAGLAVDTHEGLLGRPVQRVGPGDLKTGRQSDLRRGDRQPVQRRHQRDGVGRARQLGALQPGQRSRQAFGAQLELGLLGEHVVQQHAQRQTRARGRPRVLADLRSVRPFTPVRDIVSPAAPRLAGAPGEVALEPVERRERGDGRRVLGQPRELGLALGDEPVRQRPAAVERGLRAPALGPQLQFDLGAGRDVGVQHVGRGLGVLAEGGLQLG